RVLCAAQALLYLVSACSGQLNFVLAGLDPAVTPYQIVCSAFVDLQSVTCGIYWEVQFPVLILRYPEPGVEHVYVYVVPYVRCPARHGPFPFGQCGAVCPACTVECRLPT